MIERARFGAMPDQYGEDEEGEKNEKNEGPRLKGQLVVRAGAVRKGTLQLVDGEQSQALARLIEKILKLCEGPARKGVGAASMGEALRLLAAGTFAPELLEVTAQRRPEPKAPGGAGAEWTLRLAGRRISEEPDRSLVLSEKAFHEFVTLLSDASPESLPQSLYAASYTDVTVAILKYSRTIAGRRFLGMNPETHGEKQVAFDRITAAIEALHARLEKEGASPSRLLKMNAGVVSGPLHAAPDPPGCESREPGFQAVARKVPATLRVTAARGHLRRHAPRRCSRIAVVELPCV